MKLKINKTKQTEAETPHYKFAITFMFGDADGYETEKMSIPLDRINDISYKNFIIATAGLCQAYPNGRGGCDDYGGRDCGYYEAFFGDNGNDTLNPQGIHIETPYDIHCDSEGGFDSWALVYVDEYRRESDVCVVFSESEQATIEGIADHY